jgi:hypothetical protein
MNSHLEAAIISVGSSVGATLVGTAVTFTVYSTFKFLERRARTKGDTHAANKWKTRANKSIRFFTWLRGYLPGGGPWVGRSKVLQRRLTSCRTCRRHRWPCPPHRAAQPPHHTFQRRGQYRRYRGWGRGHPWALKGGTWSSGHTSRPWAGVLRSPRGASMYCSNTFLISYATS